MTAKARLLKLTVLAALVPVPLAAIVTRHDVPDADYLVAPEAFPYICELGGAAGTALSPKWILTAAHVAKYTQAGASVTCGNGDEAKVEDVYLFPGTNLFLPENWDHDIALVRLDNALPYSDYPSIYRDSDESGQEIVFLGRGGYGDGKSGIVGEDGRLRRAQNRVESADDSLLTFRFTAPPNAMPLEGVSGPGDSGGPAMSVGEKPAVLGVSSMQDSGDFGEGHYGVEEIYARVSFYQDWLDRVMSADESLRRSLVYQFEPCDGQLAPTTQPAEYAGKYQLPGGREIEFAAVDGELRRVDLDRELVHCGADRFSYTYMDITIDFLRNESGEVTGLHFNQWHATPAQRQ